jgi:tetratricopeptide (TPR) repeat protein
VAEALRLLEAGQATRVVRRALGPKGLPRAVFLGAIGLAAVALAGILGTLATRSPGPVEVEAAGISSPLAKQLHEQSEVYAARGSNRANLVNAVDLARRALAAEPGHPRLQAHLAHMVARLQNDDHDPAHTEEIETHAARALASDPSLGEAWFARGWLLLERRDFSGALDAALRGRDLDPRDWAGYAVAGRALVRLGRVEEGLTELRRGLDVPGGHIFVRTVLGYELLNLGRLDESAAEFTRVLEYQPDHPAALGNLASIYLMTGRHLDCVPLYQRLLAAQPDPGTASNLGTAFYYLDRIPEAIQAYERANEMDPHNPAYERNLADAYDRAGGSRESRRWYETALANCERLAREGKATPETRLLHAVLLGRLGKTAAALREADAFVREFPKDMFAIYAAAQIHAMAGRREETFELTRAAIALGYPREEFRRDPYFGALREDRAFLDLLVK